VSEEARKVYDVREVIRRIADGSRFLELSERWARNMVTGFGRIDGRPVGFVANQPRYLGGVIDSAASEKAARFVRHSTAAVAARNGSIDELLEPAETRDRLAWALATLEPS